MKIKKMILSITIINWIKKNLIKFLLLISLISIIAVVSFYVLTFSDYEIVKEPEKWGQFGDYFGGVLNPILAFFAFIALLITIRQQNSQLHQSIKENNARDIEKKFELAVELIDEVSGNIEKYSFKRKKGITALVNEIDVHIKGKIKDYNKIKVKVFKENNLDEENDDELVKGMEIVSAQIIEQQLHHNFPSQNLFSILDTLEIINYYYFKINDIDENCIEKKLLRNRILLQFKKTYEKFNLIIANTDIDLMLYEEEDVIIDYVREFISNYKKLENHRNFEVVYDRVD
jgi:uncharacterized membrane protein